ncbi:MAG TPA: methylated-DNA--[protein]-cysteine S-methyltransferase [Ktedonobacterales bacterium]|jgi:O-6-methylguanine DNA methyltransferase|nr:methylated-DNA--[protein]-cysteine S-methyltransferase [Ktedonobacterales bacterium]
MNENRAIASGLTAARDLLADLRALGEARAPEAVVAGALTRVGLADSYTTIESPLGLVYVAWNERGLSAVTRAESATAFEQWALHLLGRRVYHTTAPQRLTRALKAWLAGDKRAPLNFDLRGQTPFVRAALLKAREIPHGEVRPYSWIAREIGRPGAVRAVGTAMARNPVPLFIPCHRVVRADGHIGAYSMGGPESKRIILEAEGLDVSQIESLAESGVRYVGSAEGEAYCYPSCHHAQRITSRRLVTFASEAQAHAAGYRPCNVCRPPAAALAS